MKPTEKRIEKGLWWDRNWPVLEGCAPCSPACDNCFAAEYAHRFGGSLPYLRGLTTKDGKWNGTVIMRQDQLELPLKTKKPTVWFVAERSDLFHPAVPFEFIASVFGAISHARHHNFMVLTKRPERMAEFFVWLSSETTHKEAWVATVNHAEFICGEKKGARGSENDPAECLAISAFYDRSIIAKGGHPHGSHYDQWPLPNLWLGVTAENQEQAEKRIPLLLQTPSAHRFVSVEPMLGAIDLSQHLNLHWRSTAGIDLDAPQFEPRLNWIICGGESGRNARPTHPDWVRSLRDQCHAAGVPFFFKQWGEWAGGKFDRRKGKMICNPSSVGEEIGRIFWTNKSFPKVKLWGESDHYWTHASTLVGKKAASRLLDGKEHLDFPE